MTLDEYYSKFGDSISQESERLFVSEFLFSIVGPQIAKIIPQHSFIDRTGRNRRIDFAYQGPNSKIAFEVDGESYHAEGALAKEGFDDSLFRQNEILRRGYQLFRVSYSQLLSPAWRGVIADSLRELLEDHAPELLSDYALAPNPVQLEALDALEHARKVREWRRAVVVLPTGTGKTILSALDARRHGGRVLFIVHRLDILTQSIAAYKKAWGKLDYGILTGEERENELDCEVLFASKDTLRQPAELSRYAPDHFDYIVIDEVHHGQSPSYLGILKHFSPKFMLGMTATPDRSDRKDIFELFDYNKAYEISLHEVIERGYLVPYTYIGLTDNIDYSRIKYSNNHYRVDDLERLLIIPERNQAILQAYLHPDRGAGDKAIGFCVSIAHAERMARFFCEHGVAAAAVHSATEHRDEIIQQFRDNDLQIVFTVDLFNEGIDFPNVQVLLFLRPTESKTVFLQQLGRGLRLCSGKSRVRVLDFIGNYQRANQIRRYLAKGNKRHDGVDADGNRVKKMLYEYATGCEVLFDAAVEEILDRQDAADLGIDKQDLLEAYYAVSEKLSRKPTKQDLDQEGAYTSRLYVQMWGSWLAFLREIGEYTEASYHYPQGTHLGHILSILWYFGLSTREGTHLSDHYIRMRGELGKDRLGSYRRQLKYKLQAAMELGILEDDRSLGGETRPPELTPLGRKLRQALAPWLADEDLRFPTDADGIPSTRLKNDERYYNDLIRAAGDASRKNRALILKVFLGMHAVQQMLAYLYQVERAGSIEKSRIYKNFFATPFVKRFCEQEGIEEASPEASKRRCPFLLNILDACGIISNGRSIVAVNKLVLFPYLVRPQHREDEAVTNARLKKLAAAWHEGEATLGAEDLSILRELFGAEFLTGRYHLHELEIIETI